MYVHILNVAAVWAVRKHAAKLDDNVLDSLVLPATMKPQYDTLFKKLQKLINFCYVCREIHALCDR